MSYDTASNSTSTSTSSFDFAKWTDLTLKFNLVAGLLSSISSLIVLIIMAISPRARTSGNVARTVLLVCLFFFDFMNAFFNAISGILRLNSSLHPGVFCNFGGYIGQWSIQASDLTTFALAVITFVVAQAAYNVETLSFRLMQVEKSVVWVALGLFLFPVVTATIGYSLVGMAPSGSWCWFARDPRPLATYVRYTLTHGPRILIIFSIVIMYTILFWAFRVRIREQERILESSTSSSGSFGARPKSVGHWFNVEEQEKMAKEQIRMKADAQRAAIMKLLVYPTAYTLLWIPGLVNRFAEASGQSPETLAITSFFQFTTQLIGFANSVIYGYARFFGKQSGAF